VYPQSRPGTGLGACAPRGASIRAVPIYEYVCMECESHFEELVRGEQQVECPDCAATNVSRQFSSFAVHGVKKPVTAGGGGGGCCGGSCGCGH
jgi:putative FmdB family regulatory protein